MISRGAVVVSDFGCQGTRGGEEASAEPGSARDARSRRRHSGEPVISATRETVRSHANCVSPEVVRVVSRASETVGESSVVELCDMKKKKIA